MLNKKEEMHLFIKNAPYVEKWNFYTSGINWETIFVPLAT
jgi:hypothetical protein